MFLIESFSREITKKRERKDRGDWLTALREKIDKGASGACRDCSGKDGLGRSWVSVVKVDELHGVWKETYQEEKSPGALPYDLLLNRG